jgi:tRNA threonylcarbamoyladenosine biosynthesis protein TsaB
MRILAIETTDLAGSVAALDADSLMAAHDLDPQWRSAQSLAPGIVALLQSVGWQPKDVQLVAVATGPGSFTGLRVGVTTAKLFAYAAGAAVLGVNTLEAIAAQAPAGTPELWAVLDAQREQVFAGRFRRDPVGVWQWCDDQTLRQGQTLLLDNAAWLAQLSAGQAVSGPALHKLAPQLPSGVVLVDTVLWSPKAVAVGRLAWQQYQSGQRDDVFTLLPQYFRPSAAEEKQTKK